MLAPPVAMGWVPIEVDEDEFKKAWTEFMEKIRPSRLEVNLSKGDAESREGSGGGESQCAESPDKEFTEQRAREIRDRVIEENHEALEMLNTGSKKIRVTHKERGK